MEEEVIKDNMIKWSQNFGSSIQLEEWEYTWNRRLRYTSSQSVKENYYKIFFRWYLTPKTISKIYGNCSDLCWKCELVQGTLYHMWWTCKKAMQFWKMIYFEIKKSISVSLKFSPEIFLLNIIDLETGKKLVKSYFTWCQQQE